MPGPEKLVSFKDWMARNNRAYYARRFPGKEGDFVTSPLIHRAFGEAVARQIIEMDEQLGHPEPFWLMEFGGGNGQLAVDILTYLKEDAPDFFQRVAYAVSDFPEPARKLKEMVSEQLPELESTMKILPPFGRDLAPRLYPLPGCVLANEFLDALPVHLIVKRGIDFKEIFILEKQEGFDILERPPSAEVLDFIEATSLELQDGCFAEVNLDMQTWIRSISLSLRRGFVLVLDYGGTEEIRENRPQGTLRGFKNHRLAEVFTLQLGEGDWTSDVDFSILAKLAEREGFGVTGFSTQGNFLLGLGIAERMPIFKKKELDIQEIKDHLAMKFLFHPEGMGNAFNVLGLHKGMPLPRLSGFSMRNEPI